MKHPASTAAFLFLGLAFLVGGATWLLSGSDADNGPVAQMPASAPSNEVGFVAVSPKEQRKAANLERTQREFQRIKEIGREVGPDLYAIPDATGEDVFYSTKLVKGVGRNGEPIYATSIAQRERPSPLVDPKQYLLPEPPKFKKKPMKGVLKTGKKGGEGKGDGSSPGAGEGGKSNGSPGIGPGASSEGKTGKGG